jgi:hypothetical protein
MGLRQQAQQLQEMRQQQQQTQQVAWQYMSCCSLVGMSAHRWQQL